MATATLSPSPYFTGLDNAGVPLAGGLLYIYSAGTSTPATTWSDSAELNPNANPITLDTAGRATIYLDALSYKFILKNAAGVTIRTQDNVAAVNVGSAGLGMIFDFGGQSSSPVTTTTYTSGATFDTLHPGTAVYNQDSANLIGTYVLEAMGVVAVPGGQTLTIALVNLSDGNPDLAMVTMTMTSTTGSRGRTGAITWASPGAAKNYGIKAKVDSLSAYVWGCKLIRTA